MLGGRGKGLTPRGQSGVQRQRHGATPPRRIDLESLGRRFHQTPPRLCRNAFRQRHGCRLFGMRDSDEAAIHHQDARRRDGRVETFQAVVQRRRQDYPGVEVGCPVVDEGRTGRLFCNVGPPMAFPSRQAVVPWRLLGHAKRHVRVEVIPHKLPVVDALVDAGRRELAIGDRQLFDGDPQPLRRTREEHPTRPRTGLPQRGAARLDGHGACGDALVRRVSRVGGAHGDALRRDVEFVRDHDAQRRQQALPDLHLARHCLYAAFAREADPTGQGRRRREGGRQRTVRRKGLTGPRHGVPSGR